mgnify:CR=1 FL=1
MMMMMIHIVQFDLALHFHIFWYFHSSNTHTHNCCIGLFFSSLFFVGQAKIQFSFSFFLLTISCTYNIVRVDVIDALDQFDELKDSSELKIKLLFSIVVVSVMIIFFPKKKWFFFHFTLVLDHFITHKYKLYLM